jgi:hypothetical protein
LALPSCRDSCARTPGTEAAQAIREEREAEDLYPEHGPGHGTHSRPNGAAVIAGFHQAHISIAGSDYLANVTVTLRAPDHHRTNLRRCGSAPIFPIAGEIVFATGV